jgi:eukaryotic-like serine/threonine-protein kinase
LRKNLRKKIHVFSLKRIIIAIFLIFVFLISMIFMVDKITGKIIHRNAEIAVPNLVDMNFEDAKKLLAKYKLSIEKEYEVFNANHASNSIISQFPIADSIVRQKRIIRVVISKGVNDFEMPNVVKMDLRNAEITLKNYGLSIGNIEYVESLNIEEGKIISQNPSSKSKISRDGLVNLKVSTGLPKTDKKLMPAVLGLKKEVIDILMDNVGLKYEIQYIPVQDESQKGIAIEQSPNGDEDIQDGQNIVVKIGE